MKDTITDFRPVKLAWLAVLRLTGDWWTVETEKYDQLSSNLIYKVLLKQPVHQKAVEESEEWRTS